MKQINNIELVQVLNSGGTATVYLGIDLFTGLPVAVKELKANMFKSDFVRKESILGTGERPRSTSVMRP